MNALAGIRMTIQTDQIRSAANAGAIGRNCLVELGVHRPQLLAAAVARTLVP
jgi:hypothetical protein